ncbi:MAG: M1 family metallopeptidase [Mariniblastus sp.]|nr:M1 family metallopeptidase [Mariniblastus sp.]
MNIYRRLPSVTCLFACCLALPWPAALAQQETFTRQQKLRGSITPEREWWDLQHYTLSVEVFPETKSLQGAVEIDFEVIQPSGRMQIDLQEPLEITRVTHLSEVTKGNGGPELGFEREGNVYWVDFPKGVPVGAQQSIRIDYQGVPVESKNPPWSGGLTWQEDEKGHPFIATSCQGIGASIWWPCKDHGYDEPDRGMDIQITVPEDLTAVANGRLKTTTRDEQQQTRTFHWQVVNPINNYGVNMNIGNYVHFSDKYRGEHGDLDVDYWVLAHQRDEAQRQFKEAPRTLEAFEHWFGKYPFYEDSYKLVVVPYLGMEHQSSVTYGNGFQNGYRGTDLSGTGVGMKFDFIIVHESGHEWFGNNISMRDAADMWIHESFTNYSENLFVEYHFSQQEAEDYVIGCRKRIRNDAPIIGTYDVNQSGSGDMYYKGGNLLHTLRHVIGDDEKWLEILRGLNRQFWHQTVDTGQVEDYISQQSGIDCEKFFDQYLRSVKIPKLVYRVEDEQVSYRFENVVDGFAVPVLVRVNGQEVRITPNQETQVLQWNEPVETLVLDRNFYMDCEGE